MATQSEIDALLAQAEALAVEVSGKDGPGADAPRRPGERPAPAPARTELPGGLERILHIEVPVIVQLAEREMSMEEVLKLNVGSIIEFDKHFDAELELFVNDCQVGLGNAVKVSENFGLRVTRIGSIYETIRALGGGP